MAKDFNKIKPFDEDGFVRVVVEAPKGSSLKMEYDSKIQCFTISRALPVGIAFPYDFGFIPGTRAADGDAVDAMALHHSSTYPGLVLPCRILGMVEMEQRDGKGKYYVNNRVIVTPCWHQALKELNEVKDLPASQRKELEHFFISADQFTGKEARLKGWGTSAQTSAFVKKHII